MEPDPSNVSGEVVRKHSFEHRINWGHVALALAALYALFKFGGLVASNSTADSASAGASDSESEQDKMAVLIE